MTAFSYVTIVWSVIAAAAILLGLLHFARWSMDRRSHVDLTFSIVAFSFVGVAVTELGSMHAASPEVWSAWVKWCHLPLAALIIATIVFIRQYLGTGRAWLAWGLIALRLLILVVNFGSTPNINFDRVDSIRHVRFLGEPVTVVGGAATGRWQILGTLATFLLTVFVLDAAVSLWRQGGSEGRRRAVVIGGGVFAFVTVAGIYVQLVIWGVLHIPLLITPCFTFALLAMAYELSRDSLRASRLARDLEENRRRLELAAEAADLGMCEWDSHTNRVWATQRTQDIFGFAMGAPTDPAAWLARIDPDDMARVREEFDRAVTDGGEFRAEFRLCPPGETVRWVAVNGRAEGSRGGRRMRVHGVIRDTSGRRQALLETQELRRELAHAGRVSVLGQLASSLAHELSQPLGAILRNTEAAELLLASPVADIEELKAIVADIQRDDRRAGEVINRLRELLKRRQMDAQPLSVDGLVGDVESLLRADAMSRHVTVAWSVEPDLPSVSGDRVHLSQVLINLIINAMDAVMEREPAERRVTVEASRGRDCTVELAVRDTGSGIPTASLQLVFEPFFTTKASGMGMGLSVCRTIVDAHGGTITAENAPGSGAVFRVSMPAAR